MGLRTGSGKNNDFGIGAKLEVRAGELYQTRVVTGRAHALRPRAAPQGRRAARRSGPMACRRRCTSRAPTRTSSSSRQLKGSCAFLYTWDGKRFRFVTDVMWRSALGMPLGLMGGGRRAPRTPRRVHRRSTCASPATPSKPRDGRYVLQFTEELWETAYADEIRLLAVDHPDSVDVFVDERFVPPGPVQLRLFQAVQRRPPLSAVDDRGNDVLPALRERDDVYVSNLTPIRYQGLVEPHDLILDLGRRRGSPRHASSSCAAGSTRPTRASTSRSRSRPRLSTQLPSLEVRDATGAMDDRGPEPRLPVGEGQDDRDRPRRQASRRRTITCAFARTCRSTGTRRSWRAMPRPVRDRIDAVRRRTRPTCISAASHERIGSGGRYGPHWFAYDDVSTDSPWRPIAGRVHAIRRGASAAGERGRHVRHHGAGR